MNRPIYLALSIFVVGATLFSSCKKESAVKTITVEGTVLNGYSGFQPNYSLHILHNGQQFADVTSDANGHFSYSFTVDVYDENYFTYVPAAPDLLVQIHPDQSLNCVIFQEYSDENITHHQDLTFDRFTRTTFHIKNINPFDANDRLDSLCWWHWLGSSYEQFGGPYPGISVDTTNYQVLQREIGYNYFYKVRKNAVDTTYYRYVAIYGSTTDTTIDVFY